MVNYYGRPKEANIVSGHFVQCDGAKGGWWMGGWMDGWMIWVDGWMGGVDGDGWMEWMDGWMD